MKILSKKATIGVGATTGGVGLVQIALLAEGRGVSDDVQAVVLVLLVVMILSTIALSALTSVLGYLEGRPYRGLLIEAARRPQHSMSIARVIDADSRHEAIKSGRGLLDKEQRYLYRPDLGWLQPGVHADMGGRRSDAHDVDGRVGQSAAE